MPSITCTQPMPDYNALIPEERQKFCKLVHDLLRDNKWILLEEAQRIAYQQVCVESVEDVEVKFPLEGFRMWRLRITGYQFGNI